MSSSLRWFRKNAKVLMVVFGIGAMAIFGLGGVVSMVNPSDLVRVEGDDSDNVIARWKGGDFTREQIRRFTYRHHHTTNFLVQLQQYAMQKKGDNFRSEAMPISPIMSNNSQFNEEEVDDRVVVRMLMADRAGEEGIIVDRSGVEDYLAMVCGNVPVSYQEMKEINKRANSKQVELDHIFRHLEKEIAFQQMSVLTGAAMTMMPNPTEAIQYWDRTHRTVECKVLPLKVEDYVSKVTGVPAEKELREYYEEGKYEYPDPTARQPGFKVGKKVKAQYFVADYNTFLENEMNKLTVEEVQKEYDRLLAEGNDMVMEVVPPDVDPAADPLPGLDNDAPKPPTEAEGKDDQAPVPPVTEGEAAKEGAEKEVKEGSEQGAEASEGESGKGESGKKPDQTDSSATSVRLGARFVSFQEEEGQADEKAAAASGQEESEKAVESKAEESQQAVKPAADATPTAAEPPQETETPAGDAAPPKPAQEGGILGPTMQDEPAMEKRPRPLKDVADQIKESLKAEDARAAVQKALGRAEAKVRVQQMNIARWESRMNPKDSEKPAPLDDKKLKEIADEFNLEFNSTPVVDYDQMREEPLGKITTFAFSQDGRAVPQNVTNMIFGGYHDKELYQPAKVEDFAARSTYLYWLSEKIDQRVPEFDEAKPLVEKYWRQQQALELARADAGAMAKTVNEGKKPMSETYTEAVDTGSFTWFNSMGGIRYSTPVGVEQPGKEFMTEVFSLKEMEAGVAANEMQNIVYAIQVVKQDQKTVEQMGDDYLNQQFFTFKQVPFDVSALSNFYGQQMNYDWMDEFADSMELEWIGR
ncbi:MAG: hypothetical protein MK108_11005 [Mariniblastus sp.]|nr:hypothetical protein [Mariniblastus sp.]